jgi:cell division transport system permease protein
MSNIHLKTALGSMRRSPFQALSAVFVLTLTFFVATMMAVIVYSSSNLIKYFETRPQVIAFLKSDSTPEQISTMQNNLTLNTKVKDIKYVSKEEALSIYKKATADNPLLGELVSPSIFPASLEFSLTNLTFAEEVIAQVKKESIVEQVGFTASLGGESTLNDVVSRLRTVSYYVRIGGGILVGMLAAVSFSILVVIISMRMAARKGEIEILDLIGATPSFIRSPIMIEAVIYASLGVLIGWMVAFLFWLFLTPNIIRYFGEIPVLPMGTLNFFILFSIILGAEVLIGLILTLFGSLLAISRARKTK